CAPPRIWALTVVSIPPWSSTWRTTPPMTAARAADPAPFPTAPTARTFPVTDAAPTDAELAGLPALAPLLADRLRELGYSVAGLHALLGDSGMAALDR